MDVKHHVYRLTSLRLPRHRSTQTKSNQSRDLQEFSEEARRSSHPTTSSYSITGSFAEVERNARCAPSERSSRGSGQEEETASVLRVRNLAAAYMYMTCAQTANRASRYWRESTEQESCVGFSPVLRGQSLLLLSPADGTCVGDSRLFVPSFLRSAL